VREKSGFSQEEASEQDAGQGHWLLLRNKRLFLKSKEEKLLNLLNSIESKLL
jgi:hypothetical protein